LASEGVPEAPAQISALMAAFSRTWALCGGWAVDAWLGRQTRHHDDVDIVVFEDDQFALFQHLDGWQLIAHDPDVPDDTAEPWDGRRQLRLPAHVHARRSGLTPLGDRLQPAAQDFGLDIQLAAREGSEWLMTREPEVSLGLKAAINTTGWGIPAAVPQVLMLYKALEVRPRDEIDFQALLPLVEPAPRAWLRDAIARLYPAHPWLGALQD
jgi:hypothetical protein